MANNIPNSATAGVNAASFEVQARPDQGDSDVWASGWQRTGVLSGCAVTAHGGTMSVDVSAGLNLVVGNALAITAVSALTIGTADATNARTDLVCVNDSGVVSVTAGAAAVQPYWPSVPANSSVLATIYVPATVTAITSGMIRDKRVILASVAPVPARMTATHTTASLSIGVAEQSTITMTKSFRLQKITTDRACRVRLYDRAAKQVTDLSRTVGSRPPTDSGLLFDFVAVAGALSADLTPLVDGSSMEVTPVVTIPMTVTNLSSTSTVTVTLIYIPTE